jgi:hypothetical protein
VDEVKRSNRSPKTHWLEGRLTGIVDERITGEEEDTIIAGEGRVVEGVTVVLTDGLAVLDGAPEVPEGLLSKAM